MTFHRRGSPLVVLGFVVAVTAIVIWLLPAQKPSPSAATRLPLLDGRTISLGDLHGQPVLVTFWSTTCSPCIEEIPDLKRLYGDYHARGFELLAVAMPYDPPLTIQTFSRKHSIPYPIVLDVSSDVVNAFGGIEFVPTAFLLDPAGNVVYRQVGKLDTDRTRRRLESLLEK